MPEEVDAAKIKEYGRSIPITELLLDTDNPRLYAKRRSGDLIEIQSEIQEDLLSKPSVGGLKRSILRDGLREAIYVQFRPEFGMYVVIEGNTRAAIHKRIVEQDEQSETMPELTFDKIKAHVVHQYIAQSELSIMKVIWQTGKAEWGKCERAMLMHEQHHDFGFPIADIAVHFQCSKGDVETDLTALATLKDYGEITGDDDTSKFSFFSKECPAKVRKWYGHNESTKNQFFDYISTGRIPGVAIRGGLRDFAKFVDNAAVMEQFALNPELTVEEGVGLMVETDLLASFKWMKNLSKYTNDLYKLANPRYQSLLRVDDDLKTELKHLKRALEQLINIVEAN